VSMISKTGRRGRISRTRAKKVSALVEKKQKDSSGEVCTRRKFGGT